MGIQLSRLEQWTVNPCVAGSIPSIPAMITFKYKDKVITTPNLEKKLKRMHLTLDNIEIIDTPEKKKEDNELDIPLEKYHYYKYPDENRWLLHITDNPEETIIFNNKVLKRDERFTLLAL